MLQHKEPIDFVIASGRTETVRTFIEICAKFLDWGEDSKGNRIYWEGEGLNEIGKRIDNDKIVIKIDPRYYRPTEVDLLKGDSQKAHDKLGWRPKISLEELIKEMVNYDKKIAQKEYNLQDKNIN